MTPSPQKIESPDTPGRFTLMISAGQSRDGKGSLLEGNAGGPALDQLARIPLDAAIFATCGREDDPAVDLMRARGVPLVGVEGPTAEGVVLIDIDDLAGTAELAARMRALGHHRVAVVTMPLRLNGTPKISGSHVAHAMSSYNDLEPPCENDVQNAAARLHSSSITAQEQPP